MKIVVLLKRVPDTASKIAVSGDAIDPAGIEWVISPYDEIAVEQAFERRVHRRAVPPMGPIRHDAILGALTASTLRG